MLPLAMTYLPDLQCLQSQLLGPGEGTWLHINEAFLGLVLVLGIAVAQRVQQNLHVFLSLC